MEGHQVKIRTADKKLFLMDKSDALDIALIRTMIEDNDNNDEEIPIDIVEYDQMQKIVDFIHQ